MNDDEQKKEEYKRKKEEYENMVKHRIIMKLEEALMIMKDSGDDKTEFYKELFNHPDKNDWLVEVDVKDKPGERKFYIVKNCPENNKLLLQHQVVNLKRL